MQTFTHRLETEVSIWAQSFFILFILPTRGLAPHFKHLLSKKIVGWAGGLCIMSLWEPLQKKHSQRSVTFMQLYVMGTKLWRDFLLACNTYVHAPLIPTLIYITDFTDSSHSFTSSCGVFSLLLNQSNQRCHIHNHTQYNVYLAPEKK